MPSKDNKREKAREVVDILEEISMLLVGLPETAKFIHAEDDQGHRTGSQSTLTLRIADREWGEPRSSCCE